VLSLAQARVLLRLGRPVDVAERGLVFIQNFLAILAAKEAAGKVKPWFKEVRCWMVGSKHHCAAQHSTAQHSTAQHSTVQHSVM
jgi:hypothetical protein